MAVVSFPGKLFFVVKYGLSFCGEIPFYHFPVTLNGIANKLFLVFLSNLDDHLFISFSVPIRFLLYFLFLFPFYIYHKGRSDMHCACFFKLLSKNSG